SRPIAVPCVCMYSISTTRKPSFVASTNVTSSRCRRYSNERRYVLVDHANAADVPAVHWPERITRTAGPNGAGSRACARLYLRGGHAVHAVARDPLRQQHVFRRRVPDGAVWLRQLGGGRQVP